MRMKELTGSLPLVLVHLALAVLVDDAHPLEQVGKLWLVLFVRVQVVELALVERVKRIGRCQAVSWSANGVLEKGQLQLQIDLLTRRSRNGPLKILPVNQVLGHVLDRVLEVELVPTPICREALARGKLDRVDVVAEREVFGVLWQGDYLLAVLQPPARKRRSGEEQVFRIMKQWE